MNNIEKILENLNRVKLEKIGTDTLKTYELYDYELVRLVKKIADRCVKLCEENSSSGQGKNSCQHDIASIKEYFDL